MIAQILRLAMSHQGTEYINCYSVRKHKEFRWPASSSPYEEVSHLLPNHMLDLETGHCSRYWPDGDLRALPLDEAVERVSSMLSALVECAAARFDVVISLTAGLDSRLVLAASKSIAHKISYLTVRQIDKPEDHADVTVPSVLLARLGLKHDIVKSSWLINDEFMRAFMKGVALPHYIYLPDAYAIFEHFSQKKVAITGGVSEIGRWSFRKQIPRERRKGVTPEDLAKVQKVPGNKFAVECFAAWLAGLHERFNVDPLDLFEWEQGHGVWLANCQLEFDIAWKDILTPFNCRDLLIAMLSVPEEFRMGPIHPLHQRMISRLWPDVLNAPINPHDVQRRQLYPILTSYIPESLKQSLKRILRPESSRR
jgi:hypothetical protein